MIKAVFFTTLAFAAAPALAQSETAPAPSAPAQAPAAAPDQSAIQTAAQAFGQCVSSGIQGVDAAVTPEAGASSVMSGCASQRQQLEQAVEGVIATLPEEQKTAARTQLQTQLAQAQPQIAAAITRQRTAAAAPAAPAPAEANGAAPTPSE